MSRVDNIINGVKKSGVEKKKSRVESIIESSSNGNLKTGVDSNYIQSFISDVDDFFSSASDKYKDIGYGNASSYYDDYTSKSGELVERANTIKAHLNSNKGEYDEDSYNYLLTYIDEIEKARNSIWNNLRNTTQYYSKWDTEDAYNKAVAEAEKAESDYKALLDYDQEAGKEEIRLLERDLSAIGEVEQQISQIKQDNQILELAKAKGDRNAIKKLEENNQTILLLNKTLEDAYAKYGSESELKGLISQKRQYHTLASRTQEGVELASVADNEDFLNNSQYVSTEFKPETFWDKFHQTEYGLGYDDLTHQYINGDEEFRAEVHRKHDTYSSDRSYSGGESRFEEANLDQMNDDEIKIYNYYYNTEGKEKAEKYIDSLKETLNYRKAQQTFEGYEDKVFLEMMFGVEAGLDQFKTGIENLFSNEDYIPASDTQIVSSMIREDLADKSIPIWYNFKDGEWEDKVLGNSFGQMSYDAVTTTSNMLPSIMVSFVPVVGQAAGAVTLGASAAGHAKAEMLNRGYSKGQANFYGLMVGASEAGLQYLLGGITKFGGKAPEGLTKLALSKVDNAFARVAISLGMNMASEGLEESLQTVIEPWLKSLATGVDFESPDIDEVLYSGLLGAVTSLIMEGGTTIAGEVNVRNQGANLKKSGAENVTALANLGKTFAEGTAANRLANKVNENSSAYTIGRLLAEVGGSLTETNVADIASELQAKGMSPEAATSTAKWLYKAVDGGYFNKRQQDAYLNDDRISDVHRNLFSNEEHSVNKRNAKYDALYALAQEMSNNKGAKTKSKDASAEVQASTQQEEGISATENASKKEIATENEFGASETGKTKIGDTEVTIKEIASVKNGEVMLRLDDGSDDGSIVKASDVTFGSFEEGLIYETIAKMDAPLTTANALVKGFKASDGVSAQVYSTEIPLAYQYGKIGYQKGLEKLSLTSEQKNIAYILGRDDVKASGRTWSDTSRRTLEANKYRASDDGIIYEGFELKEDSLTDIQKASLEGIRTLAKMSPSVEFHIYESIIENGIKYAVVNGKKVKAPNGYFRNGNEIYIDLNAGKGTRGAMLYTASHEIVHFIATNSFEDFQALADFLFEHYGNNNVPVEYLIKREIDKLKKSYEENGKAMPSEPVLYMKAYEEVVANAMSKMLADPKSYEKIAKLKSENLTLWEKMGEAIKHLLDKLKSMLGIYEGREPDQMAADYVNNFTAEVYEQLQDLYLKAYVNAQTKYEASIGSRNLEDFADAKNTEGDTLLQYKAMEADEDTYRDMLKKWGKMTNAQIDNLFATIDTAIELIKDNLEALDYAWETDIDDRAYSPIKANSDKLYKVSLDFSTLCRKRLLQQTVQVQLQEALDKALTREEGIAIRDALIAIREEGRQIEVACALCYVESARMKSPEQIKKFMNNKEQVIKEFFAGKSGGTMKEKIAKAEADTRETLAKENPNGIKGKDGKTMVDPLTAKLKELPQKYAEVIRAAKREAKASYKPTAEEQRLIDIAKGMTVSDFTSPKGLENLAKNYPALFDAYTSYVRNATKSKGIEGDVWWRVGDSQKIGDVLIANMNKENGLRSQSWSDFQVIHILDYIAATIELATREAKEQAYTKVPDFAELMGKTGVMINLSLIPTAKFNGKLEYDSVEGMAYKRALELRNKYPDTVGTICIGINNEQIRMLLADMEIDYVIPYHKSGMSAVIRKAMHIPTWEQYEDYQGEKNLSRTEAQKRADKYGVKLLSEKDPNYQKGTSFSEWFDLEEAQQIAKMENANPSDKAKQKEYGIMYGGYMAMQNAAQNYLKLCAERGLAPKFSYEKADFTAEDNYWKLLIDRKMVNNATGEVIEQQTIKPIFDEGEIMRILNDELERYPKVKEDQEYAIRTVTEKMLSGEVKGGMSAEAIAKVMKKPVDNVTNVNILASAEGDTLFSVDDDYSNRDFSYNELVAKGDLQGVVIDKNQQLQMKGGLVDANWLINEVRKKCKVQNTKGEPVYYTEVPDIGRNVEIFNKGLTHGFDRPNDKRGGKSTPHAIINAKATLDIVEILRNSIEVNRSQRGTNKDVPYTHVLMGAIELEDSIGNKEYYAVRSMVQERTNRNPLLVEVNILGTLTSTNAKKIGSPAVQVGKKTKTLAGGRTYFAYSIAHFLQDVKGVFDDTFSNDVYMHLGTQRTTNDFSANLLYSSDNDNDSISTRSLLANALESAAQNDIEKNKLALYKSKIDLIEAEQAKLAEVKAKANELRFTKGRTPDETKKMKALDFEANQIANRINTYDRQLLNLESTTALKNVLQREKAQAYKRAEQKGKEALAKYKEKSAQTQRELMNRYQESRKKGIESRNKTEIRHKIKDIVSKLNSLLLDPTKDKHVPIGLQKPVAAALDIINMDTVGAEQRLADINKKLAKENDPAKIEHLLESYRRISTQSENLADKLNALKAAYADIKNSEDKLIKNSHNEAIESLIENTIDVVGNTSLRDMSLKQLESVYDMYKAILATVRNANKMFKEGIQETVTENSEKVKTEVKAAGGHRERVLKVTKFLKKFGWNMLKPIYAMKLIGSNTFTRLYENVRKGEDTWAVDVNEAKEFFQDKRKKYNYDSWDFKKQYTFNDSIGNSFSLSLEQIMSLYAYSKRDQADLHLEKGGFIFDDATEITVKNKLGIPMKYEVNDANPYILNKEDLGTVIGILETDDFKDVKGFVDDMQAYLSDVMGAKGNEVSLAMYDIKLYNEKHYFPLKTAKYFREFDPEKNGTPKIRNSGFSKKTVPKAGNPIVLSNFMDVWANHVNDMSMYHAFVLPLEDLMRVYNYSSTAGGYDSVQQYIKNAYGAQANTYIENLMNDLNGGARTDPATDLIGKGMSLFKKSAVFASASVVIQQPSAIARALAYIDPKYFVDKPEATKHKETWAEVKKYAPVAIIKEMGYFDTNMGRSTVDWIRDEKTLMDKIDDVASKAPALADELAWCAIWKAVKREIAATTNLKAGSEEFLKAAGDRFTEVVTKTQVYDSVLSRSALMRSKDTGAKMVTAFMAEPTTSLNMVVDAIIEGKRGNKKFAGKAIGAVSASIILNSIRVSLVTAARDDDEDETYTEKYLESLTAELIDGFNPLTYVPLVKDVWSIMQGYDIERSDMSIWSDFVQSVENLFSDKKSGFEKTEGVVGSIAAFLGLPVKNLMRDARAMYNLATTLLSGTPTTRAGVGEAIGGAVKSSIPLYTRIEKWAGADESKSDKLYDAIMDGDKAHTERLKSGYKDEKAINTAIRTGLRENDSRIKEAAQARIDGDISEYTRIVREIIAEGNFVQDIVVGAVNAEINAINAKADEQDEATDEGASEKVSSIYKGSDINDAFESGDTDLAVEIIDNLIDTKVANGMEEKNAKSSVRSSMTSYWKPLYIAAYKANDKDEMYRIRMILKASNIYGSTSDILDTCKAWLNEKK